MTIIHDYVEHLCISVTVIFVVLWSYAKGNKTARLRVQLLLWYNFEPSMLCCCALGFGSILRDDCHLS